MAKAKSVHSTPRRIASKIKAKKSAKPAESKEQRNLRHGEAFRDLEMPMFELYCMAEISAEVATGVHEDQNELVHFVIYRICEMVRDLRAKYRADLHAVGRGKAGGRRQHLARLQGGKPDHLRLGTIALSIIQRGHVPDGRCVLHGGTPGQPAQG